MFPDVRLGIFPILVNSPLDPNANFPIKVGDYLDFGRIVKRTFRLRGEIYGFASALTV